jgi:cytochrome oxidase Cu insertion factor (SCO1/SenC/PrrC family)
VKGKEKHMSFGTKQLWRALTLAAAGVVNAIVAAQGPVPGQGELKVGDLAPDFALQASDGQTYSLSKLRGKTVVLAWFPKAFTAG